MTLSHREPLIIWEPPGTELCFVLGINFELRSPLAIPRAGILSKLFVENLASMAFRPPVSQQGSSVGGGATLVCFKRPRVTAVK